MQWQWQRPARYLWGVQYCYATLFGVRDRAIFTCKPGGQKPIHSVPIHSRYFAQMGCRLFLVILWPVETADKNQLYISENVLKLICSNVEFQKFSRGDTLDPRFRGRRRDRGKGNGKEGTGQREGSDGGRGREEKENVDCPPTIFGFKVALARNARNSIALYYMWMVPKSRSINFVPKMLFQQNLFTAVTTFKSAVM